MVDMKTLKVGDTVVLRCGERTTMKEGNKMLDVENSLWENNGKYRQHFLPFVGDNMDVVEIIPKEDEE
jgi:hypothetical protein